MEKNVEEEIYTSEVFPSPPLPVNELLPSVTTDDQNDLILAAELGKALLERNRALEARIAQLQLALDDGEKETLSLHRQVSEARQKIRMYEELDLRNSELERECDRLRETLVQEKRNTERHIQRIRELEQENESEMRSEPQNETSSGGKATNAGRYSMAGGYESYQRASESGDAVFREVCTQTDSSGSCEKEVEKGHVTVRRLENECEALREALAGARSEVSTLREALASSIETQRLLERRNAALRDSLFERDDRLRVENFLMVGPDAAAQVAVSTAATEKQTQTQTPVVSESTSATCRRRTTKENRAVAQVQARYAEMMAKYDSVLFDLRARAGSLVSRSATLPNLSTAVSQKCCLKHSMERIDDEDGEQSDSSANRESPERAVDLAAASHQDSGENSHEDPPYRRLFRDLYDLIHKSLNESASSAVRSATTHYQNLVEVRFDPKEFDTSEWDDLGDYVEG